MALYLRVMFVVGLFSMLIAGTLTLGHQRRSPVVTHDHENMGKTYPLDIVDLGYGIRLKLAGTRCFDAVPTWYYQASHEAGDLDEMGRWFVLIDEDALAAVERLKCELSTHAAMYHFP